MADKNPNAQKDTEKSKGNNNRRQAKNESRRNPRRKVEGKDKEIEEKRKIS